MATSKENWKRPPVVEVALAVQFAPMEHLNPAYFGEFWRLIGGEGVFAKALQAQPIQAIADDFGETLEYSLPGIVFAPMTTESRIQFVSRDETRMVQIQNGWLVVNWVKQSANDYPGFEVLLADFRSVLGQFTGMIREKGLGTFTPNLWEVTYIDHIVKNTVWEDHSSVASVLPGLLGPSQLDGGRFEAINSRWTFFFKEPRARLAMGLVTARSAKDAAETEMLVLTTSARGPITPGEPEAIFDRLNSGRSIVVGAFKKATSAEAKAYWKG